MDFPILLKEIIVLSSGQNAVSCKSFKLSRSQIKPTSNKAFSFSDFDIPINIATSFVTTLVNLPPVMTSPKGDPSTVTITTKVPEVPSDITCNYDVVVAIDLECIDNEENSVVSFFVENLITDIFAEIAAVVTAHEEWMSHH